MPKVAKELGALEVGRLVHSGGEGNTTHLVGGVAGLMLQITPAGGRSWILKTTVGDKRRHLGLGSYPEVRLADARRLAGEAKEKIRNGVDPVEERRANKAAIKAAQVRGMTFSVAADRYLATMLSGFRNPKHRQQWENTLATYATPHLGAMLVSEIAVQDVLRVLAPIWETKTETATRVRGRIEAVLAWATVNGYRTGDNPAKWVNNLDKTLQKPAKVAKTENHPAVQLGDVARWFSALRERDGIGSRALEFTALTAARSGEVRGATWDEIDLDAGVWTVPAERTKTSKEHRVPLCRDAVALLKALPRHAGNDLVFPAAKGGQLSDMTLSATMKRLHEADMANGGAGFIDRVSKRPAVPHGLRSVFRDWAAEITSYPSEMAELALAHTISNKVEAAYRRGAMFEKRRHMMRDWADYLSGKDAKGDVVALRLEASA